MPQIVERRKLSCSVSHELWRIQACQEFGSRRRLDWRSPYDLFSTEIFVDKVFGDLAHHEFVLENSENLLIKCYKCKLMPSINPEVCQAHTGVIWGLLEACFRLTLKFSALKAGGKCCLIKLKRIKKREY